jgi:uncharacterized coiled-coil protein SlyX
MRRATYKFAGVLILCALPAMMLSQSSPRPNVDTSSAAMSEQGRVALQQKLGEISTELIQTREQLARSQQQMELLQSELLAIQKQLNPELPSSSSAESVSLADKVADLSEQQDILKAQVKIHDQSKVESSSKYPVRINGLILFNTFVNDGVVDNLDLPEVAGAPTVGVSNGSVGAGLRQTILGIEGVGPRIGGARTFANVDVDFFAGLAYGNFGTSTGTVRMRTASINMDWKENSLQAGIVGPLISPLSPTSYATVAQPGMAWAGNLWTWAPQISFEHRISLADGSHLGLQLGLWDSPGAGSSASQLVRLPTPGELAKQPAYEGRFSYSRGENEHRLKLGLGGYYERQSYSGGISLDSWAATADWLWPISSRFELSGEGYRGRSLGGLGGGVYKDVVIGTNPITGLPAMQRLNAIGGWTQWKTRFGHMLEANAVIGQDSGFAADFHAVVLPTNTTSQQLRARNEMIVGNMIFRPKTYFILSPEYRRIMTWPINSPVRIANIFTFTIGYEF